MSYRSRLLLRPLEQRITPTTYAVTNTQDAGSGSLRQAILDANANPGADSIAFDATVFATEQTITLNTGEMTIADPVTISGPALTVTIDANKTSRIFNIDVPGKSAQPINIAGLNLINGLATTTGGGAILNYDEALALIRCNVSNNNANNPNAGVFPHGGAICLTATAASLTLMECQLNDNMAKVWGGAIFVNGASAVSITKSVIASNNSGSSGGGIYFFSGGSSLNLIESTVSANKANQIYTPEGAGGLYLYGTTATIRNCTISGNIANDWGGIYAGYKSVVTIQNSTIAFNSALFSGRAGGIRTQVLSTVTLDSTIVAKNYGRDIYGVPVTANNSLIGNTNGATINGSNNVVNVDPLLGPLANNGGPTMTHALLPGSSAIDKGSNPANLPYDQRGLGFNRKSGASWDIGAFEGQVPFSAGVTVNDGAIQRSMVKSLAVTFNDAVTFPSGIASAFQLQRTGPGSPTDFVSLAFSQTGNIVNITFIDPIYAPSPLQSLIDGAYKLTLVANKIQGTAGFLDGDNNGTPGGDLILNFHRLFGDGNGDGRVDSIDFAIYRSVFGTSMRLYFDANNDGVVNAADFTEFRKRFGLMI